MGKVHRLSENEKKLLHAVGNYPDASIKELLTYTSYTWKRTIMRKLNQLREQHILHGSFYDISYSSLCKNPFHKLVCILETDQTYETVISYVSLIESLKWIYPVLSPHKRVLSVGFFSSHDAALRDILQLLKDNNVITDYIVRVISTKRIDENPNLFGDFNPSLDNLFIPCDVPDMNLGCHQTVLNECDISIVPYLERGEKLIEILRKEKNRGKPWTYDQIKYSHKKMVENKLIEKKYLYYPFLPSQCVRFHLFLKLDHSELTQRILHNFAKGGRIQKKYVLLNDWGMIACTSHPLFLKDLMYKLDSINGIKEREVYPMRSFPPGKYFFRHFPELIYYDFEAQTVEYPYRVYKEKIKERLEHESARNKVL